MQTTTAPATSKAPRRRWLRWLAGSVLLIIVLLTALLGWLLGTASGLRFALARVQSATHDALHVQQAHGRLIGPLELSGVHYDDGNGTVADIAALHMDLRFWPLLRKRAHVLALDVDGVNVALPAASPDETSSSTSFSLKPPIELLFDHVHVGSVKVTRAGKLLFASNRLDLAGRWTDLGIELTQLALQAPDGHAELTGRMAIGTSYQGNGNASFAWKVGSTDYTGTLAARSDGKLAHLDLELAAPMVARLQLDLTQSSDDAWTASLDVPRFDPKPLLGESSLKSMAANLRGHGDRYSGTLDGRLELNDYTLLLQPLQGTFSHDFNTLTLQQLGLGSPQIKGQVAASGVVHLDARPLTAALDIRWSDLQLPADLAGQLLASHGELKASGSAEAYHAEGDVAIGPPGKLAALSLNLDGTAKQIALHTLALKQPQGGMQANGTLTLQPTLSWQVEASANHLDPGQLFAGWNGALDFDMASSGTLPKGGPDATLEIRKFAGKLRDRAVSGDGKLRLSPNQVVNGKLRLASGGSTVTIDAKDTGNGRGASNDVDLILAIASLGDWLPNAGGRMDGHFTIRGKQPKLSVNGQLQGHAVAYQQNKAETLQLIVGVPDLTHPAGKLELQTSGVTLQGLAFQNIHLLAEGSQQDHRLSIDARGTQVSGELTLRGSLNGKAWNGTLSTLNLDPQGLPRWRLLQPTQLAYNDGTMNLSELCLSAGDPQLCVAAKQDKPGNLDASYRLQALPLALLLNASGNADLPMRADGTLEGSGKIRRTAAGALSGNAAITSVRGTVTYTDHADQPLLGWRDLALTANLDPARQLVSIRASLDDGGRLDGQLSITGAQQALDGQLTLHLNSLAPVELFTAELADVKGDLDGNFHFAGTLKQPSITGQALVAGFAAEVPSAGLKLSDGRIAVSTTDAKRFRIDGSVKSGEGSLTINGSAGLGATAQTSLTLRGSRFTAADIPAAKVVVSPDITLKQDARGIAIGGSVALDSADVNVDRLPGAGATKASPDVVVVDQKQQEQAASQMPISASVKVDLGGKTHLIGMGLDGNLTGTLNVVERPGRATTGQGQIAVSGTYRAYGQNLQIERGQLLFASTPIDNPGLNIRAGRKLNPNATIDEGQEVGLLVSGTAQRPILTVFSNPVMEQSDALSYLITGKPLSEVKGGEGSMVSAAAQALGSAGGDLLAKRIGSKLGVDDIGVSSSEALGGNSAFTVGKYLSPRLYLSYGVGLFEPGQVITLRYRLSQRWNFEAQNATDFNRASLNYRFEK
ncbi:MAG: translocation/assembly module TamB domain-containing protein [Rhodanobacter sp.]